MAEPVDLQLLGEHMKRLQGDVRTLKSDLAQVRAEQVKVESGLATLDAKMTRLEMNMEAFRESVSDQFDQQTEFMKASFRILSSEIQSLKKT